jgi:hypothetical protein
MKKDRKPLYCRGRMENGCPVIGWGLWKKEWLSYCSAHHVWNEGCPICQMGCWHSIAAMKVGIWLYRMSPLVSNMWDNRGNVVRWLAWEIRKGKE